MKSTVYYINGNLEHTLYYNKYGNTDYLICTALNKMIEVSPPELKEHGYIISVLDWLADNPKRFTRENINKINCALSHNLGKPALSPFDIDTHKYEKSKEKNEKAPACEEAIPEYLESLCSPQKTVYSFYLCKKPLDIIIATLMCLAEQGRVLLKCKECGNYFASGDRATALYCGTACKNKNANRKRLADETKAEIRKLDKAIRNYFHPNKADPDGKLKKENAEYKVHYKKYKELYDQGKITKDELIEQMNKYNHRKEK